MCMSKKSRSVFFSEKKTPEAQRRTQPVAFKNTGVYLYLYLYLCLYISYTYIYIYTSRKSNSCLLWIYIFLQKSQKSIFPQIRSFGDVFPYLDDCLLKTKMVRTVHRNILYSMYLKICDSKREFGTKSKKWRFQK